MTRIFRRVILVLLAAVMVAAPAARAAADRPATVVDHIGFDYLPPGLGHASNFVYAFQRVNFKARVWETHFADGWRVDLDVDVMRGSRLTSPRALHDWFIRYEQRDPTPRYRRVHVRGHAGWLSSEQVFWLIRPGLAVSVAFDGQRWSQHDVRRTALSSRRLRPGD
jgi:hypothetical protein